MSDFMTLAETADYLKVKKSAVYDWRYRRIGPPGFRLGNGQVRYRKSEVDEWLESQRDADRSADATA